MKTDTPRNHDIFTACPTLPFPPKLQQPPFPSNEQAAIQGLATERVSMTQDVKHRARQNTPHEAPRAYSNHPIKSQGLLLFCRITHKHTTQTKSETHTHTYSACRNMPATYRSVCTTLTSHSNNNEVYDPNPSCCPMYQVEREIETLIWNPRRGICLLAVSTDGWLDRKPMCSFASCYGRGGV